MWNYSKDVMDHFLNPRNVGEIADADAIAEVGNITCGDALKIFLKLDKDGKIVDAKFKTFGCASAIASSSALTELVKGMTLEEAGKVTNKDIVKLLGELPEEKMHCSVMGMEALQAAIANYYKKSGRHYEQVESEDDHEGRIVCKCFGVTDVKIRKVAKANNIRKAEQITSYTKAGGGCGCCLDDIQEILDGLWHEEEAKGVKPEADNAFAYLSMVQKAIKIQEVIDKEVRPTLEKDGGSIELVDIRDYKVLVRLKGHCAVCQSSKVTLKKFVEAKLREFVSSMLEVVDASTEPENR